MVVVSIIILIKKEISLSMNILKKFKDLLFESLRDNKKLIIVFYVFSSSVLLVHGFSLLMP